MTVEEYRELIYFLRDVYPNCGRFRDRNVCNAWWEVVRSEDYSSLRAAAAEHAREKRFPPDIYDLFSAAKAFGGKSSTGSGKSKAWMKKYIAAERGEDDVGTQKI